MKLRNKKTGEIAHPDRQFWEDSLKLVCEDTNKTYVVNTIAELNAEWEDYEEAKKGIKYIEAPVTENDNTILIEYYTKEEAERAVEKLKAWKRLKDYYIKFRLDFVKNTINFTYRIDGTLHSAVNEERIIFEDMKTIFGGEDDKK